MSTDRDPFDVDDEGLTLAETYAHGELCSKIGHLTPAEKNRLRVLEERIRRKQAQEDE